MKTNVKQIELILNEEGLKLFRTVPTFKNLLASDQLYGLVVGSNTLRVNHYIYSKLVQVSGYSEGINII